MTYNLPSVGGKWRVAHGMDGFADIVNTKNMDFDTNGAASLAQQPVVLYTNGDDSNFGVIQAIVLLNSVYYIVTIGNVFSYTPGTGAFAEQTITSMSAHSNYTDAVSYLGAVAVSAATAVESYNGSAWTSRITGLTSGVPHPMAVFENRQTLCVGNGNIVFQTTAGTWTEDSTNKLTLPSDYTITWMRWRGNNLYIGTRNVSGGAAKLFIWNGSGTQANQGYSAACEWIYSGVAYQDTMVILTSTGQLLRFNGGGFNEMAHFPVYDTSLSWSISAAASSTKGRCTNRGMVASGSRIYLNIDGGIQDGLEGYPGKYLHNQPSGIWVYDPGVGLYHRAGSNYTKYNTLTITALNSSILTVGTHNLETGDEIQALSVSNITGLTTGRDYFVIKVNATQIQLAFNPGDAIADRYITLSGTPSGDTLNASTLECGSTANTLPGAVAIYSQIVSQKFFGTDLLFGATVNNASNTAVKALMSFGVGRNVGSIVTSELDSIGIREAFQKIYAAIKGIVQDSDEVRIKVRKIDVPGLPTAIRFADSGLATWTSNTIFTVLTTTKDFRSASIGDEVEIVEGAGSGYTAHITDINTDTTTYTVTLDEAIPGITAGNTSDVIVQNWKKLGTIDNTSDSINEDYAGLPVEEKGSWAQFKIELRGRGLSLSKLAVVTSTDKPPK